MRLTPVTAFACFAIVHRDSYVKETEKVHEKVASGIRRDNRSPQPLSQSGLPSTDFHLNSTVDRCGQVKPLFGQLVDNTPYNASHKLFTRSRQLVVAGELSFTAFRCPTDTCNIAPTVDVQCLSQEKERVMQIQEIHFLQFLHTGCGMRLTDILC